MEEMELDHFSHQHPLILHETEPKENGGEVEIICQGCDKPIVGTNYSCRECNYFMHASCAQLPRQIKQHSFHPKHPLTLVMKKWSMASRCHACDHRIGNNLAYTCADRYCDFNLGLNCVSLPQTIENRAHQHPFTLLAKRAKFCCDACGTEDEGMSYMCTTCLFWVHLDCASLPDVINLRDEHVHPLTLITSSSFQGDHCRICDQNLEAQHWVYSCVDCSFGAHVDCATSKRQNNTKKSMWPQTDRQTITQTNQSNREIEADQEKRDCTKSETESSNSLLKTKALGLTGNEIVRNCATDDSRGGAGGVVLDPMPIGDELIYLTADDVENNYAGEEPVVMTDINHFSHQHCLALVCEELKNGSITMGAQNQFPVRFIVAQVLFYST